MGFIVVYITNASEEDAQKIAGVLIEERLIACANIFPIQSSYLWKGTIQNEGEWVAIVKTIPSHWQELKDKVRQIHPYEVPCIMKFEVEANDEYEAWIKESVK